MINPHEELLQTYQALMCRQIFEPALLDYSILERHTSFLQQLARIENSGISVFDLFQNRHVFASHNFQTLFGYDLEAAASEGNAYFDSRVHPEDFILLLRTGVQHLRMMLDTPAEEKTKIKVVNEYRILDRNNAYIRVIEQHQALELDLRGNVWLSLGVIDVSPNQDPNAVFRSSVMDFRTGRVYPVDYAGLKAPASAVVLSEREKEVMALIRDGYLSKEISDMLSISVHTVNTHRQRILKKLDANNSIEALRYARQLGLLQ